MTNEQWREFLLLEVIRNEVVDDEVAMMVPGLQHAMKQVISSNLWDECGNGNIDNFHTTWLRMLVSSLGSCEDVIKYRKTKPWFSSITSNSFNYLLTTPGKGLVAYGHFFITESWVAEHFTKMLFGMNRVGLISKNTQIYFSSHKIIDKFHTIEILTGMRNMQPRLSHSELVEIVNGAHQAIAAGTLMYNHLIDYFKQKL